MKQVSEGALEYRRWEIKMSWVYEGYKLKNKINGRRDQNDNKNTVLLHCPAFFTFWEGHNSNFVTEKAHWPME